LKIKIKYLTEIHYNIIIIEKRVPVMREAVAAYKSVAVSPEFYEIERLRDRTRHNEASALGYAEGVGAKARETAISKRLRELGMSEDFIKKAISD
jgi:hypothetical protein